VARGGEHVPRQSTVVFVWGVVGGWGGVGVG